MLTPEGLAEIQREWPSTSWAQFQALLQHIEEQATEIERLKDYGSYWNEQAVMAHQSLADAKSQADRDVLAGREEAYEAGKRQPIRRGKRDELQDS